jgi:hypothetical protein
MEDWEFLEYLNIPFCFRSQPIPIQPQSRTIWGLSILVLILRISSRKDRSSITRLHLLNWGLRDDENRKQFIELIEGSSSSLAALIRCDPGFDQAIKYAIAESLVEVINGSKNIRICLSDKGRQFANEIIAEEGCLEEEKKFLRERCSSVTERLASKLLGKF